MLIFDQIIICKLGAFGNGDVGNLLIKTRNQHLIQIIVLLIENIHFLLQKASK